MSSTHKTLQELERVAKLLDNQFKIGPFKFGIDPLIGLIPGIGDIIPVVFSLYLINLARREKLEVYVIHQIIGNTVIDFIIGTVPLAGDIGDFFFKASAKNVELLRKELHKKHGSIKEVIIEEGEVV